MRFYSIVCLLWTRKTIATFGSKIACSDVTKTLIAPKFSVRYFWNFVRRWSIQFVTAIRSFRSYNSVEKVGAFNAPPPANRGLTSAFCRPEVRSIPHRLMVWACCAFDCLPAIPNMAAPGLAYRGVSLAMPSCDGVWCIMSCRWHAYLHLMLTLSPASSCESSSVTYGAQMRLFRVHDTPPCRLAPRATPTATMRTSCSRQSLDGATVATVVSHFAHRWCP